jgi:UDP-N-acetylglucosamine 3-dehydrogenase
VREILRAGLVGLGVMGRNHARVLNALAGIELVAAADPRIEARNSVTGVEVVPTVRELIERGIDMCVIATPTDTHKQIGLELAEAGVATLIEKPLAHDSKAAQTILEAFERNHVLGCVGHIERFNPALQDMRRRLDLGELGELYQVVTRRQGPFPARITDAGVVLDLSLGQRADGSPQWPAA